MPRGKKQLDVYCKFHSRKQRKRRGFYGRRHTESPQTPTNASARKLGMAGTHHVIPLWQASGGPLGGSRIIDMHCLSTAIASAHICPGGGLRLGEDLTARRGLASLLHLTCTKCGYKTTFSTSKQCTQMGQSFEVNRRSVFASSETGGSHAVLDHFCELMDLPPPISGSNYQEHLSGIQEALEAEMIEAFKEAATNYRQFCMKKGSVLASSDDEAIFNATVSIDGTWVKRGFTSLVGAVIVILMETGQVIDAHVLSRVCPECQVWESRDRSTEMYKKWKEEHEKSGKCQCNFKGSAPAMEAEGASVLFACSVERYKLRYRWMVSDGDSKYFARVSTEKPYGDIAVEKLDCIGHVSKWMGTRLRDLKKKWVTR